MNFVKFTENNDNEGESWNFWLQLEDNEDQLKQLDSWLGTFDEDGESYELDMKTILSEKEVDTLVEHGGQGYMNNNNKITGKFTCPQPNEAEQEDGWEWLNDKFYKGDIDRYFKETE
jgi:hypothetical protein